MEAGTAAQRQWFDVLYRQWYGRVVDYARRRVGDAADDVAAEVFTAAWRHRDSPEGIELPWLIRAASFEVLHQHRTVARSDRVARRVAALPPEMPQAEDHLIDRWDAAATVTAALTRLSDADQELLRLLAWDQMTPREIAAVLGCSGVAARVRIHRAARRLAAVMTTPTTARTNADDDRARSPS